MASDDRIDNREVCGTAYRKEKRHRKTLVGWSFGCHHMIVVWTKNAKSSRDINNKDLLNRGALAEPEERGLNG